MSETLATIGQTVSVWLLPVIIAITMHEAAHGWVADRLGDDTARRMGRVSFNPLRHVDPIGTLLLPAVLVLLSSGDFLFGWAKPVPVAFHRLGKPKRDMIWVALAGPGINIAMAFIASLVMHPFGELPANQLTLWIWENLRNFIWANVLLATFNLIPLPPLDGGRVVTGLLPGPLAYRFARLEPVGIGLLLLLAFILPLAARELGYSINPLASVLGPAVGFVHRVVMTLSGW